MKNPFSLEDPSELRPKYEYQQLLFDKKEIEIHYRKWQNYYNFVKKTLEQKSTSLKDLMLEGTEKEKFFSAQYYYHKLFFDNLSLYDNTPSPEITKLLIEFKKANYTGDIGISEQNFFEYEFLKTIGNYYYPSGWAVAYLDKNDSLKLKIKAYDKAEIGFPNGEIPLIVIDLYEHSYIRKYGNDKLAYVKELLPWLNWKVISDRYKTLTSY